MLRKLLHLWVILVVALASPTASVVRLSCADSGATTVTMCSYDTGCASDACCPDGNRAAMQANCCRSDVFSLANASPVPASFAVTPLVCISFVLPVSAADAVSRIETFAPSIPLTRNLPLLV